MKTRPPFSFLSFLLLLLFFCFATQLFSNETNIIKLRQEKTTHRIFKQLKQARGLGELDGPFLRIVKTLPNDQFKIAMADNLTDTIYIQNDAISICLDFMAEDSLNGLAFILSHELAHVTHHHGVRHQFINQFQRGFADNEITMLVMKDTTESQSRIAMEQAKEMSVRYQIRKNEAEADLDAGFTSYLAGYSTKTAGPQFLDFAYEVFGLRKNGGLYASLSERKLIAKNTGLKLDTLIKVYELGNSMNIIGEYANALKCYEYVAKDYASKELLNNMGVMSLSVLAQEFCGDKVPYFVPVTLDFAPDVSGKDVVNNELKLYKKHLNLINTAIHYFEKASNIDQDYYVAKLNKSIALWLRYQLNTYNLNVKGFPGFTKEILEDDLEFAKTFAILAKQVIIKEPDRNFKALSDVYTQLAVIEKQLNQDEQARLHINKAIKLNLNNSIAKANRKVFNGSKKTKVEQFLSSSSVGKTCTDEQLVDEEFVADILMRFESSMDMKLPLKESREAFENADIGMAFKNLKTYTIQQFKKKEIVEDSYYTFVQVNDKYISNAACQISKNSSKEDVISKYGIPQKMVETPKHTLLKFESEAVPDGDYLYYDGIVFVIDSDSKVTNWIVYEKTKMKEDKKIEKMKSLGINR